MKWFRHDADANQDAKLKRLRMKYGLEGYGLYWYCLELVASEVDVNKLTFELEHDAEIIAFDTGIHYERVQEMMSYMVGLGLFENSDGTVTCLKLAKRLDQSMTSNPKMRKMIAGIKGGVAKESCLSHDERLIESCKIRVDETREDKPLVSSRDATNVYPEDFEELWGIYPKRKGGSKKSTYKAWVARLKQGADKGEILYGVRAYAKFCELTGKSGTEYVKLPQTFLGPGEHYSADWSVEHCPHKAIARAWNEVMPAHIDRVSVEDWIPGTRGYDDLQSSWEMLKTRPRESTGRPAFTTEEQGVEFYRMLWERLAKSRKLVADSSSAWCRFTWAVKHDTTIEIARGVHD